ncbi:DNA-directed RNA polymerase II subunit RPB1 [Eurytemora carolleeae]|uniref:DNA-directed RNA polymerase II subunit RPB1 n=1 Tax=Eurytemora carolleeae TaxID=1294199 RepID=UPI000C78E6FF|nr:DNA-directed RNA polymerase II subunit RPB1 [Eurytemora carolleeae]|eukprot:XP_023339550.1 DNA-directed RNA polymerase II subunit RPB1-like [Eurytemora affinis]
MKLENCKRMSEFIDWDRATPVQSRFSALPNNSSLKESLAMSSKKGGKNKKLPTHCVFCKNNGWDESLYNNHVLKDLNNRFKRQFLFNYVCPICKNTGYEAHTINYCPYNEEKLRKQEELSWIWLNLKQGNSASTKTPSSPSLSSYSAASSNHSPTYSNSSSYSFYSNSSSSSYYSTDASYSSYSNANQPSRFNNLPATNSRFPLEQNTSHSQRTNLQSYSYQNQRGNNFHESSMSLNQPARRVSYNNLSSVWREPSSPSQLPSPPSYSQHPSPASYSPASLYTQQAVSPSLNRNLFNLEDETWSSRFGEVRRRNSSSSSGSITSSQSGSGSADPNHQQVMFNLLRLLEVSSI